MTGLLLETLLASTSVYVNTIRDIIQNSPIVYFSRITAATENSIIGPKGGFSLAGHICSNGLEHKWGGAS